MLIDLRQGGPELLQADVAIVGTNAILLCFQVSLVYLKLRQNRGSGSSEPSRAGPHAGDEAPAVARAVHAAGHPTTGRRR